MSRPKPGRVTESINAPHGELCVDLFVREDGSRGFQEYRRDVEDASGWFPVGFWSDRVFRTEAEALSAASDVIGWLPDVLKAEAARRKD